MREAKSLHKCIFKNLFVEINRDIITKVDFLVWVNVTAYFSQEECISLLINSISKDIQELKTKGVDNG